MENHGVNSGVSIFLTFFPHQHLCSLNPLKCFCAFFCIITFEPLNQITPAERQTCSKIILCTCLKSSISSCSSIPIASDFLLTFPQTHWEAERLPHISHGYKLANLLCTVNNLKRQTKAACFFPAFCRVDAGCRPTQQLQGINLLLHNRSAQMNWIR